MWLGSRGYYDTYVQGFLLDCIFLILYFVTQSFSRLFVRWLFGWLGDWLMCLFGLLTKLSLRYHTFNPKDEVQYLFLFPFACRACACLCLLIFLRGPWGIIAGMRASAGGEYILLLIRICREVRSSR